MMEIIYCPKHSHVGMTEDPYYNGWHCLNCDFEEYLERYSIEEDDEPKIRKGKKLGREQGD